MSQTKSKLCVSIGSSEHPHTTRHENHYLPYDALFLWPNYEEKNIIACLMTSKGAAYQRVDTVELKNFFVALGETHEIYYMTSTIEWTNANTIELLLKLTINSLRPYRIPITHIHIGDTHHGDNAISTPLRVLKQLENEVDFITCNQFHHLHFFNSTKYISLVNIPKISPYSRHIFQFEASRFMENEERGKIWFGAIESRFHHRRNKFLNYILKKSEISERFTMKRFGKYNERILQIMSTSSSLYIPLSSSIGFNNVVPAYIIGKPVWQYPLSEYTGQQKLCKIFDQKINIVNDTSGLIHIPKYKEEKMQLKTNIKRNQKIYENEITTTFSEFLEVYTGNTEKREIMEPRYWDTRYEALVSMAKKIDDTGKDEVISIYQDIQTKIERYCSASVSILFPDQIESNQIKELHEYGRLVFIDLAHNVVVKEYRQSCKAEKDEIKNGETVNTIRNEFDLGGYKIYFELN